MKDICRINEFAQRVGGYKLMADCLATLYVMARYEKIRYTEPVRKVSEQPQKFCGRSGFRAPDHKVTLPKDGRQGAFTQPGIPAPGKVRSSRKALLSSRLGLLNPDSSCTPQGVSTESEMPKNGHAQLCASF